VKCSCPDFRSDKKRILLLQMLISCNLHDGNFWIFFHIFSNQCLTRSYGYMCLKMFFIKNLLLVLEMAVLECFWWKHSQKPSGVNLLEYSLVKYQNKKPYQLQDQVTWISKRSIFNSSQMVRFHLLNFILKNV